MARGKSKGGNKAGGSKKRAIERYEHSGKKRVNNPPVGLVTPETDPPAPTHKTYEHHPPAPSLPPGRGSPLLFWWVLRSSFTPHLSAHPGAGWGEPKAQNL